MKKLLMCLIAFAPIDAQARQPSHDPDTVCRAWGSGAVVIMMMRQQGVALDAQLKINGSAPLMSREETIRAYEVPRFETEEAKQKAENDFRDEIELQCYKNKWYLKS
jgi:hypothetical protein